MPIDAIATYTSIARQARIASAPGGVTRPDGDASGAAGSFSDSLVGLLTSVDQSAGQANQAITNMVRGTGDVHETMIALQRAETTLQLTVQVRNKLVQAYQDIMRMPI